MGPLQIQPFRVRVDLGVIAVKENKCLTIRCCLMSYTGYPFLKRFYSSTAGTVNVFLAPPVGRYETSLKYISI